MLLPRDHRYKMETNLTEAQEHLDLLVEPVHCLNTAGTEFVGGELK